MVASRRVMDISKGNAAQSRGIIGKSFASKGYRLAEFLLKQKISDLPFLSGVLILCE